MNTNVFRLLLLGSLFSLSACVQQSEVRQMKHSVSTLNREMTQLIDILHALKDVDPATFRLSPESFRWVPASTGGLTAPSLHRQERRAPPLKCYERHLHRRSLYIHIPGI